MRSMLKFMLTFIFVVGSVAAEPFNRPGRISTPDEDFCSQVFDHFSVGGKDFIFDNAVTQKFKTAPTDLENSELRKIVNEVGTAMGRKPDAVAVCADTVATARLNKLSPMSKVFSIKNTSDAIPLNTVAARKELQKDACDEVKSEMECTPFDTDPANIHLFQDVLNASAPVIAGCNCIKENVRRDFKWRPEQLAEEKKRSQDRMQGIILGSFGEKFINDYAVNMEDVTFFNTNSASFFGKDTNSQNTSAVDYQCSDSSRYQAVMESKCKANGISKEEQESRLKSIFISLAQGDKDPSIKGRLADLDKKVQILDLNEANGNAGGFGYSRSIHDTKRFGLSRKDDASLVLNDVVMKMMSDPELNKQFLSLLETEKGRKPLDILARLMDQESSKNIDGFIQKYLSNPGLSEGYQKKARTLLMNNVRKSSGRHELFKKNFEIAMAIHPGIKAMMTDDVIFKKTVAAAQKENKSLAETLEMNDSILGSNYRARCKKLIDQLSEAACLPREKLIGAVKGDDLTTLLSKQTMAQNKQMEELLICEAGDPQNTFELFSDITMKNSYNRSDLYDRLTQPKDKQTNAFRRMAENNNTEIAAKVDQAVRATASERSEVQSSQLASNRYSEGKLDTPLEKPEVVTAVNEAPKKVQKPVESSETTMNSTQSNFSSAPTVLPTSMAASAAVAETKSSDVRSEVREAVSNKDNQEKVDKLLSNADDSSMRELLRLREESVKNREKLLELTSEREKQKLKDLEEKIKLLEQQKQQVASAPEVLPGDDEATRTKGVNRNVSRDVASVRPMDASVYSGNHSDSSTTGSTGGGGGSASLGSSSSKSGSSAARNRSVEASTSSSAGASGDGIIVVSSSGVSQGGQSGSTQEVSQELINYLSTTEPDLSSLAKIKSTGMLYKFKVMENGVLIEKEMLVDYKMLNEDAKKLVERKLASKQINQIEQEIVAAKRVHSFQALKIILGEQLRK